MSASSAAAPFLDASAAAGTEQVVVDAPPVAELLSVEEWARSLNYTQFRLLTPESMPYVTPQQISTIPNSDWFVEISEPARAAMLPAQVQALKVSSITLGLLLPHQVQWLSTAQIQSLNFYEFQRLFPSQIPLLTTTQIASINDSSALFRWTPAQKAALTLPQVQALDVSKVWLLHLTPTQIGWLTIPQVRSLRTDDLQFLRPEQVKYVTAEQLSLVVDPAKFGVWPEATRAALTLPQVQSLNVGLLGVYYLFDNQVGWLTQAQVQTLEVNEFQRLFPGQIPQLTKTQIASINDSSVLFRWTPEQKAALTLPQVQALNVTKVWLLHLTPTQVNWLTTAQVQAVRVQDIAYLTPQKVPLLSLLQIAAISTPQVFSSLPHEVRVALTPVQVQALNVAAIGATLLTDAQVQWLTAAQVGTLPYYEFERLSTTQVPMLTAAQIASIPDSGSLRRWSTSSRAALTRVQMRAMPVSKVGLEHFTPLQISWLYISQVRSARHSDFQYLNVNQIQYLTRAQMSTVPSGEVLLRLSDEARAQLTRTQLLSLPWRVWAEYANVNPEQAPPENYNSAVGDLMGEDGNPVNPHMAAEEAKAYALVPLSTATHVTIGSGVWSNPAIWLGGRVPSAGARVVVSAGTMVHFDATMTEAISTLRIDGVMRFFTNRNTQLKADTIVVTNYGSLFVGAVNDPIQDPYTASIVIADSGPINAAWDPYLISRGIISMGSVQMYGKTVTPYATFAVNPARGDTTLRFNQPLVNWKVGDTIVIAGNNATFSDYFQEERIIRAISGTTVIVDPLTYDHFAPAGSGLSVHAANLSRNVQLKAEDGRVASERPHLMFMHSPLVNVHNISVTGFGRTDKSVPINDPVVINNVLQPGTGTNVRARYAMHFHHTGVNPAIAPAVVKGSVINGSPGWGFVNHQSNVLMENNVAVGVYGASFVTEDGNEIGAMIRNLSLGTIGARQGITERREIHDFGFRGHGFWMQGPGVSLIGNISSGNRSSAFAYFTASSKSRFDAVNLENPALAAGHAAIPVGAVPLREFTGNVAYGSRTGLEIWHHQTLMPGDRSIIDNFTTWNTFDYGIDIHYSGNIAIRNSTIISDIFGVRGIGVQTNWLTHDVSFENLTILGFQIGIDVPVRGQTVISRGRISALQAVFIEKGHDILRSVYVTAEPEFTPLSPALLEGRQQYDYFMYGNYTTTDFNLRSSRSLYDADDVQIARDGSVLRLYYYEQSAAHVPFPTWKAEKLVAEQLLDKTNLQLQQLYRVAFAGGLIPTGAKSYTGIFGLAGLVP